VTENENKSGVRSFGWKKTGLGEGLSGKRE